MKTYKEKLIWSDLDLIPNFDIEDYREDFEEYLKINDLDVDRSDDMAMYEWAVETNSESLEDERRNLDIQLSEPILVIAQLSLWRGKRAGYKEIASGNIKDCLYSDRNIDSAKWYVDRYGDLRSDAVHHDGTNHLLYRVFKRSATKTQRIHLKQKILAGKATRADITRVTRRLGDDIGNVYGWDFPKYGRKSHKDTNVDK